MDVNLLHDYLTSQGLNKFPEFLLLNVSVEGDLCFYRERCVETDAVRDDTVQVWRVQDWMIWMMEN